MDPPYNVYQNYNQNGNGYNDKYHMNYGQNDYNYQHNVNQTQQHHARIRHRASKSDTTKDFIPQPVTLRPQISSKAIICYGDKVRLRDGRDGIIKFIGTIGYREHEIWYGLVLETPTGNNNGIQQNRFFFQCPPKHGLFVGRSQISAIIYTRVSPENGNRYCIKSKITCRHGTGSIRFIGHIPQWNNNPNTIVYGISLKKRLRSGNNGMHGNVLYFVTKPYHGIFLTEKEFDSYRKKKQSQIQRFAPPISNRPQNIQFAQSMPTNVYNPIQQQQHPYGHANAQRQTIAMPYDINQMTPSEAHIYTQSDYHNANVQSPMTPSVNMRSVFDQGSSSDEDETDAEEDINTPSMTAMNSQSINFASILDRYKQSNSMQNLHLSTNTHNVQQQQQNGYPQYHQQSNLNIQPPQQHIRGNTANSIAYKPFQNNNNNNQSPRPYPQQNQVQAQSNRFMNYQHPNSRPASSKFAYNNGNNSMHMSFPSSVSPRKRPQQKTYSQTPTPSTLNRHQHNPQFFPDIPNNPPQHQHQHQHPPFFNASSSPLPPQSPRQQMLSSPRSMAPAQPSQHQYAKSSMNLSGPPPSSSLISSSSQPFLAQSSISLVAEQSITPPATSRNLIYAQLKQTPDGPFDVRTTQEEFTKVAADILSAYNNPRGLFKLLGVMASKLRLSDPKYRTLDPQNPAVQKKIFKREGIKDLDNDIGPESVKEFLRLLGFKQNARNGLLQCAPDQPPIVVIENAANVCRLSIIKCNESRKALINIRKHSKTVNALSKDIKASLKGRNLNLIGGKMYGNGAHTATSYSPSGKRRDFTKRMEKKMISLKRLSPKRKSPKKESPLTLPNVQMSTASSASSSSTTTVTTSASQLSISSVPSIPEAGSSNSSADEQDDEKLPGIAEENDIDNLNLGLPPPPPPDAYPKRSDEESDDEEEAESSIKYSVDIAPPSYGRQPTSTTKEVVVVDTITNYEVNADDGTQEVIDSPKEDEPCLDKLPTMESVTSKELNELNDLINENKTPVLMANLTSSTPPTFKKLREIDMNTTAEMKDFELDKTESEDTIISGWNVVYEQTTSSSKTSLDETEEEARAVDDDIDGENDRFALQELIWSVTHHENMQSGDIRDVLLLCHPVFTSPVQMLESLSCRFLDADPENSAYEHAQIQIKVSSFIQYWMRKYFYQDFYLQPIVLTFLEDFLEEMRAYFEDNEVSNGSKLPLMIEQTMNVQTKILKQKGLISEKEKQKGRLAKKLGLNVDNDDVKLESIKNDKKMRYQKHFDKFYSENNKKIAQQFVLMAFKLFCGIEDRECLEQNWKGKDKETLAPNILKVIENFNAISNWIQMTILSASNASKRSKWIVKWLKIGSALFELHDFQTLAAIHGALTSQAIFRQNLAWKKVPMKYKVRFKEFKVIYDSRGGHKNLRTIHRETVPPIVPYAGVLLQVLFQIDEGSKSKKKDGSVNFSKLMRLHAQIQKLTQLQKHNFEHLKVDSKLQEFLKNCLAMYKHMDRDALYEKSTEALNLDDPKRLSRKK